MKEPKQIAETVLPPMRCCVCGKKVEGFYGRWRISERESGGTCSRKCEDVKESESALSRFTGASEETDDVRHEAHIPVGETVVRRPRRRTGGRVDL